MIIYFIFFALLILCLYCGQVLGLMIHCDNCGDFNLVKKYVFLVPLLKLALFFPCLHDCIHEKNLKALWFYLFSGRMSMVILCVMVDLLPEWKKQQEQNRIRRFVKQYESSRVPLSAALKSVIIQAGATLGYDI